MAPLNRAYDPDRHHRRSIRLRGYDYAQCGAYFVTICIHGHAQLLGKVEGAAFVPNDVGRMVTAVWNSLPARFSHLSTDVLCLMPNHLHAIPVLSTDDLAGSAGCAAVGQSCAVARPHGTLPGTVGRIVQAFKSLTTREYVVGVRDHGWEPFEGHLWQRNYYEHIIRDEEELNRIRAYILANPGRWAEDAENPLNIPDLNRRS